MMNLVAASLVVSGPVPSSVDGTDVLAPAMIALDVVVVLAVAILIASRWMRRPRLPRLHYSAIVRRRAIAIPLAAIAFGGTAAHADPVADHLQCYKITDATRKHLRGIVDLDAPSIGVAPGCRLGRAKLYCAPAKAAIQPGSLSDGSTPLTEEPYHGPSAETERICYDVTCPPAPVADRTVTDRMGTHVLRRPTTEMICTPASSGTLTPPATGFQLTSPPIEIDPGQNVTYCYYFRTPNMETVPVRRFVSELGPGIESVVMFTTPNELGQPVDRRPPGEVSVAGCDVFVAGFQPPRFVYAGDTATHEVTMPADDGAGHPVALEIPPNSSGFVMIHHHNTTAQPITTRVRINAEALESPIYTVSDTMGAYTGDFAIPPYTNRVERRTCATPDDVTFWRWSTRAHKQSTRTAVFDADTTLLESFDWSQPTAATWPTPPFHTFTRPYVTWSCDYANPTSRTIRRGPSQQTDEECMAFGYFFPATKHRVCWDSYVFPLL